MQHSTEFRNDTCQAMIDKLGAAATFVIKDGATTLAVLPMADPAFQEPATGSMQSNAVTPANATASGVADVWEIRDSVNAVQMSGTFPGDLNISGPVNVGAEVSVSTLTYTAMA